MPNDLSYLLEQLGHDVTLLRKALPSDSSDEAVLRFAHERGCVLLTCNRDDFLRLATTKPHHGVVIVRMRFGSLAPHTGHVSDFCMPTCRVIEPVNE